MNVLPVWGQELSPLEPRYARRENCGMRSNCGAGMASGTLDRKREWRAQKDARGRVLYDPVRVVRGAKISTPAARDYKPIRLLRRLDRQSLGVGEYVDHVLQIPTQIDR